MTTAHDNQAPQELKRSSNSLDDFFSEGQRGLALVEARMRELFRCDAPILTQISEYLLQQGGKRVRPLLVLAAARLFHMKEPSQEVIDVAAGIEMIHMATLLHDDIIDESPTRRHRPSAFKQYGLPPSLLAGDFLLVRAFGLCAKLAPFVIEQTEQACVELTEGEVLEGHLSTETPISLSEYETVVAKKTASLFSLSAAVGAFHTGTAERNVRLLGDFGRHSGIAFQMVDDILDITAEEDLLGKPSGTDLRQQTPSLVNILWLESGDPRARELFSASEVSEARAREAVQLLRGSAVITRAREIAQEAAERARKALNAVEGSDERVRDELLALLDYTLNRCY